MRGAIVVVCLSMSVVLWGNVAQAQMVVSDPTNLVQNAMSAASQARQVTGQVKEIQQQLEQLQLLQKDLESLSTSDLARLGDTFRRLQDLFDDAEQISMQWGSIASEYDEVYQDFDPQQHDLEDFQTFQSRWQEQTNNAMKGAMISHGVVQEYESRQGNMQGYLNASDGAQGTLAAIQAGNHMAAMLSQQMMELNEVIVADSRARLSYLKEQSAKEEAESARAAERMLRDYGGSRPEVSVPNSLPRMR